MRRLAELGLVMGLSVATACGNSGDATISGPSAFPEAVPMQAEAEVTTTTLVKAARQILDFTVLPPQLPPAVREQVPAALELEVSKTTTTVGSDGRARQHRVYVKASAVNLGGGNVLTAGHVVRDDNGDLETDYSCGDMLIYGETQTGWDTINPDRQHSTFDGNDLSVDDLDLLQAGQLRPDFLDDLPHPDVLEHIELHRGDPVFFVNYQPDATGGERSPALGTPPAIFGGLVLGRSEVSGNWLVLTGMAGYGDGAPDITIRQGGSGGMVVDERGNLVGISVSAVVQPQTARQIEADFLLDLVGDKPDASYWLTFVEPFDQAKQAELKAGLRTSPEPCLYRP